jgi:predicted MFS family arabinose efflux permease
MMQNTDPHSTLWIAKFLGAFAGSAISVAYILPKGRREAAIRFATGVTGGLVLGTTVGAYVAHELGIDKTLTEFEVVLMGSSIASLFLWWTIGVVLRATDHKASNQPPKPNSKSGE